MLWENNPDLIFVKDNQYRIVQANKAFLDVYQKDMRNKIIGYTTLEAYDEKEAQAFLEYDRIAFEEGYSETIEKVQFPDGQIRELYTRKIRFENPKGEPFILGISRDITEREALIEKLTASNEELERFAYVASHDLQEPLRMVRNFTQLIKQRYGDKLDDDGKKYIDISMNSATRMQELIDDLLEYARIGEDTEKHETIKVENILKYTITNLQI